MTGIRQLSAIFMGSDAVVLFERLSKMSGCGVI